jgi:hypothetical protein
LDSAGRLDGFFSLLSAFVTRRVEARGARRIDPVSANRLCAMGKSHGAPGESWTAWRTAEDASRPRCVACKIWGLDSTGRLDGFLTLLSTFALDGLKREARAASILCQQYVSRRERIKHYFRVTRRSALSRKILNYRIK